MTLFVLGGLLLLVALFLMLSARQQNQLSGLPAGDLLYSDDLVGEIRPVLFSHRHGLKGKPDALVRIPSGDIIPVERKKSAAPKRPYDGDLMQASVYCILVEEQYGKTPPFMRIQYANRHFDEPFTPERKEWVLKTAARLRLLRHQSNCSRSHSIAAKCRRCSQQPNCGQSLVIGDYAT